MLLSPVVNAAVLLSMLHNSRRCENKFFLNNPVQKEKKRWGQLVLNTNIKKRSCRWEKSGGFATDLWDGILSWRREEQSQLKQLKQQMKALEYIKNATAPSAEAWRGQSSAPETHVDWTILNVDLNGVASASCIQPRWPMFPAAASALWNNNTYYLPPRPPVTTCPVSQSGLDHIQCLSESKVNPKVMMSLCCANNNKWHHLLSIN